MAVKKIVDNVWFVGAEHWDRRLFDEIIPLPDGTSYNAYIIKGNDKIALIDAVDPATVEQLYNNIKELNITKIDYLIANHAEQDHAGAIVDVIKWFPTVKVVTNEKCKEMLKDLLLLKDEQFVVIKEGEELSLGGKTLKFIMTPWVHWPETMSTYLVEDKILFSCDFFGSHIATSDIFASEHFYVPAKRYYAEIMSPFRNNVRNNIDKVCKYEIKIIAPSHGYIYFQPSKIIDAYKEWASDNVKNEAIIAWVSMHGSTKKMAEYLSEALIKRKVNVHYFNLTYTDAGAIAMALIDAATLILGAPTVLAGVHPTGASAAYLVNALRPKTKIISLFSSYGWGEKASEVVKSLLNNIKAELIPPVIAKGYPKEEDFKKLDIMADEISRKHKDLGLL
ncbi:MAG: FprA family A-type flavoprotein [Chitinispirillaceae bacterium]|nr:FprA family A-type flavoprotein [Chitinispirillaceae bacterium]